MATTETERAEVRRATLREVEEAIKGMPPCPFDSPHCKLEPHEPCPVCGDKGDDVNAPSHCQSPLSVIRKLGAA